MATRPRQGLNATLSYKRGSTTRAYRLRVNGIVHGPEMVADESQARLRRAYYPHRVTTQQFGLVLQLIGWDERRSFTNWMASYASYALDPDLGTSDYPTMSVTVPSYEFVHRGVPLSGYEWGDHVGSMVFTPTVMFVPAYEPWDKSKPSVTRVDNVWRAFTKDEAIKYFYPFGTQLSGDEAPQRYDSPVYPGNPSQFNDNYSGSPGGTPDGGDISPTK